MSGTTIKRRFLIQLLEATLSLLNESSSENEPISEVMVGSVFETISLVCGDLASETDPFADFGNEPTSPEQARSASASFISNALQVIREDGDNPYASIGVRSQTFASVLLSSDGGC